MIISTYQVQTVLKTHPNMHLNPIHSEGVSFDPPGTLAEIKYIKNIKKVALTGLDVRKDRIALLKSMISKGNYPVSGEAIAEKMINRSLVDNILK